MARRLRAVHARRLLGALVVICLVPVILGILFIALPHSDDPKEANVVFVLGPPTPDRLSAAISFQKAGAADTVLVSVLSDGVLSASQLEVCKRAGVECQTPDPATTAGEVAMLNEWGVAHAAESAVVVTFRPHVSRARLIFSRCSDLALSFVSVDDPLTWGDWAYQLAYQSAATIKAVVTPCV